MEEIVKSVAVDEDIELCFGLVEGEPTIEEGWSHDDFYGDSSLEKTVICRKYVQFLKINNEIYVVRLYVDKEGNVVHNEYYKF